MVYYFCVTFYGKALTLKWLANQYGQDHATVLHAKKQIEKLTAHKDMSYVVARYRKDLKLLTAEVSKVGVNK
jgi:chromosomal replication initiation ATPase DnaA